MKSQNAGVEEFFDNIADSYKDKYSDKDRFLEYFFTERLDESTRGIKTENMRVLDIGAGTGNLYDRLVQLNPDIAYYAIDISSEMLAKSAIPRERYSVGSITDVTLPFSDFGLIFMLGVTTYINDSEMKKTAERLESLLMPGGTAIVSFTNSDSLDWKMRRIIKAVGRKFLSGRSVLGQAFSVYARSPEEALDLFGLQPQMANFKWLNHTVFPLNQVFKGLSVKIAMKLHKKQANQKLMRRLSSDFLVIFTKEQ